MLTVTVLKRMDGKLTCSKCRQRVIWSTTRLDSRGVVHFEL